MLLRSSRQRKIKCFSTSLITLSSSRTNSKPAMSLRRRISCIVSRLERISICQRSTSFNQSIITIARRTPPHPQSACRTLRHFTTASSHCEKKVDDGSAAPTSTSPTSTPSSSTTTTSSSPASSTSKIYTYEDIVTLSENPNPNRVLIGASSSSIPFT